MNLFKRLFNNNSKTTPRKKEEFSEEVRQKVNDYFGYLLTIYNDYVEQYNKNKFIRESINKDTDVDAYLRNIDNGIRITRKAIERIKTAPYVYDIPKSIGQFMSSTKSQYVLSLENYMKRDEVIKKILAPSSNDENQTMEDADVLLAKADQHLNSAMNYMEKARALMNPLES